MPANASNPQTLLSHTANPSTCPGASGRHLLGWNSQGGESLDPVQEREALLCAIQERQEWRTKTKKGSEEHKWIGVEMAQMCARVAQLKREAGINRPCRDVGPFLIEEFRRRVTAAEWRIIVDNARSAHDAQEALQRSPDNAAEISERARAKQTVDQRKCAAELVALPEHLPTDDPTPKQYESQQRGTNEAKLRAEIATLDARERQLANEIVEINDQARALTAQRLSTPRGTPEREQTGWALMKADQKRSRTVSALHQQQFKARLTSLITQLPELEAQQIQKDRKARFAALAVQAQMPAAATGAAAPMPPRKETSAEYCNMSEAELRAACADVKSQEKELEAEIGELDERTRALIEQLASLPPRAPERAQLGCELAKAYERRPKAVSARNICRARRNSLVLNLPATDMRQAQRESLGKIAKTATNPLAVTDHAVLRYMERVMGFDVKKVRQRLQSLEIAKAAGVARSGKFSIEPGVLGVTKDGVLLTVYLTPTAAPKTRG